MRCSYAAWSLAALVAACSPIEGPLLHARPLVDAGADGAMFPMTGIAIEQSMAWQYQLSGALDFDIDADLFVIDLFQPEEAQIAALHASGKIVVAYLSAGTVESYRDDADRFPEEAVGEPLENYPNESWLDVRNAQVRALMAARLDVARAKGFDGIVPTSLSGYLRETGFDFTAADQRDYSAFLAAEAHARGLHVCMTDDYEQVQLLAEHYDWAVHFGCIARGDCDELDLLRSQGKPVFDVELEGEVAGVCARAADLGINVIIKRPSFDAYRVGCQ